MRLETMTMELPAQTFFKPNANWWVMMAAHPWLRYRELVDVGAGMGHLTDALVDRGYTCRGIDHNTREGQSALVENVNAEDLYLTWDECAIIARPCHGIGLDLILKQLVGTCEVLYVGLDRNVEDDLDGYVYTLLAEDVGEDGENCWRVLTNEDEAETWCLIMSHGGKKELWRDGGRRWESGGGGGFPKGDEEIFETHRVADDFQLYRTREEVINDDPTLRNGWIEPDGAWYPGHSQSHSYIMGAVFGISEGRAEAAGFVRCYGLSYQFYTCNTRPTAAQVKWLKRLKFRIREHFEEVRSVE